VAAQMVEAREKGVMRRRGPQGSDCPLLADIVAKVGEGHLRRNNRIDATNSLDQHCASALDLESIYAILAVRREKSATGPRPYKGIRG